MALPFDLCISSPCSSRTRAWPMRRMAFELVPTFGGAGLQFRAAADNFEIACRLIDPNRQRQAPVALLRNHPIAHVAQPIELARFAVDDLGQKRDRFDDAHDL